MKASRYFPLVSQGLTLLTISSYSLLGWAQNDSLSTESIKLPKVTVKAARYHSATEQTAIEESAVDHVNAQQAAQNIDTSLADWVRYLPGVQITNSGRYGSLSFNVRGLDNNRVSINLDGLEMPEGFGPSTQFMNSGRVNVDTESLIGLNIIKGGDAAKGTGFGGDVQLRLKSPQDFLKSTGNDQYASLSSGWRGDSHEFFSSATLAGRRGDYESLLVLTKRNGKQIANYQGRGNNDPTQGPTRATPNPGKITSHSFLFKLQKHLEQNGIIGIIAENYQNNSQLNMRSIEDNSYKNYFSNDAIKRTRLGIYQHLWLEQPLFDDVDWRLDWQRSKNRYRSSFTYQPLAVKPPAPAPYPRFVDRGITQTTWQAKADFSKSIATFLPQHWAYGFILKRDNFDNLNQDSNLNTHYTAEDRFSPRAYSLQFGAYLQNRLSFANEQGTFTPALRFDHYEYHVKNNDPLLAGQHFDNAHGNAVTGQLGGTWNFTSNTQFFAKTGLGFRAPAYEELYYTYLSHQSNYNYRIIANPHLKPEHSQFVEAGLRFNGDWGNAEINAFYSHYRDFIKSGVPITIDPAHYMSEQTTLNIDRAIIRGLEAKSHLNLHQLLNFPAGFSLQFSASYMEGKQLGKNAGAIDTIPPVQGVISIAYDAADESWGGALTATFANHITPAKAGTYPRTNKTRFAPSAYQLYDLTAYYKPLEALTIRAGIFNLLDKKYWIWNTDIRNMTQKDNPNLFTQPGRNVGVSMQYVF